MKLEISGFEETEKIMESIAPRHAASIARTTVHSIAGEIKKEGKANAPKRDGVLKKAIKHKRKRSVSWRPRSDVYVEHGKGAKNDAWYWHFIEFGTNKQPSQPFFLPIYNKYKSNINKIWKETFFVKLKAKLVREAKKNEL